MARPKIKKSDKKQAVSITLTKSQLKFLQKLGGGNISHGVRIIVDNYVSKNYIDEKQKV